VEEERATGGTGGDEDRDPDLVTLEGLESELGDLDAELAHVERADDAAGGETPSIVDRRDG
jgi:hypothetical protein